ncbi:MAG: hypothetical protein EPO64_05950 [Nitrospirae bacterium]|nr:MAG: hypothetical protein EPO64_05950 [Nitrospirota bacterium]
MAKAEPVGAPVPTVKFAPKWTTVVAAPLLYAMIVPLIFVDISLEFYHRLAFPILGIPTVSRGSYIKLDRHLLPYLPFILKLACIYCGYANGLVQYAARIAGDTERYFCPIKHQAAAEFHPPPHHQDFIEYGDAEGFRKRWEAAGRVKDKETGSQTGL